MHKCRCQQLTARQVLYLTSQVSEAGKQEVGQGMLHILIDAFTQTLDSLPASPPSPSIALPPTSAPKLHAQQHAPQSTNGSVKDTEALPSTAKGAKRVQHRPRQSAEQVRAESQQLLRQQRASENESRHESTRQARKKLPAFGKRDELLAQLRQRSVLIISGATGVPMHMTLHINALDVLLMHLACMTALSASILTLRFGRMLWHLC